MDANGKFGENKSGKSKGGALSAAAGMLGGGTVAAVVTGGGGLGIVATGGTALAGVAAAYGIYKLGCIVLKTPPGQNAKNKYGNNSKTSSSGNLGEEGVNSR